MPGNTNERAAVILSAAENGAGQPTTALPHTSACQYVLVSSSMPE
jgi:hypothetical protein